VTGRRPEVRDGQFQQARRAAQEIVAIEPTFSAGGYVAGQAYKEGQTLERLADSLREAGLPE